jgi:hypothetical protein
MRAWLLASLFACACSSTGGGGFRAAADGATGGATDLAGGSGGDGSGGCVRESDADFCARLLKNCDLVSGFDNCGVGRSANCGACPGAETCGGGGTANVCGGAACVPDGDAVVCQKHGAQCGSLSTTDNCNMARTVSCGSCPAGPCVSNGFCDQNNHCVGQNVADGTSCGDPTMVIDRRSCLSGQCLDPYSYCDQRGGQFVYQKNGTGGSGYGPCECLSPTHLHFEYNIPNLPIPPQDDTCAQCVTLGTRAVCF